ncbi:unnamed protein product, partial [Meganyctiphanes norvegica]
MMADVSPSPSSDGDSELHTHLDLPVRKGIDNDHESNRKENVGALSISLCNKHKASRKTENFQKKGKNNETLSVSSNVSQEKYGTITDSLNTDTEDDCSGKQTSIEKNKIRSTHCKGNKTNTRRSRDDNSKNKSNNILSRNKMYSYTKHEEKEYRHAKNSETTIEENVSSESVSGDIDDAGAANRAHDSSLPEYDNEKLSEVVVDSRVIKKFSYLAATLK